MPEGLVVCELIRLGGHRVLATERVAAELELLGHARRVERQEPNPLGQAQAMRSTRRRTENMTMPLFRNLGTQA